METLSPASMDAVRAPRSAAEAIMPALQNVKRVLLSPFSVRKWLKLALIAFLAGVMGGGGSGGGSGPSGNGGPDFDQVGRQIVDWYQAHTDAIIAGAIGVGIVGLAVFLIMLYVSSVFRFIFMESVITTKTRIRNSWHRNKAEGLAYMWWRIGFGLASLLLVALLVGGPVTILVILILGPARGGGFAAVGGAIVLGLVAIFFALICALVIGLISAMTRDFVLPLMYLRRIGSVAGWRAFWPILCGNKLGFLIYFLLKVVLAIAAGIAGMFGAIIALLVAVGDRVAAWHNGLELVVSGSAHPRRLGHRDAAGLLDTLRAVADPGVVSVLRPEVSGLRGAQSADHLNSTICHRCRHDGL